MPTRAITHGGIAAIELTTAAIRLVAVHGTGPRIAAFGPKDGESLLIWDEAAKAKRTVTGKPDWHLRGGHRVWTARPGADENEETYACDDAAGTCEETAKGFIVRGANDAMTGTQRSIEVTVRDDRTLQVDNVIENTGDMLWSGGLWALSCSKPGKNTRYVVPLGDGHAWDTATITLFRAWAGHGTGSFVEDQFATTDDAYVLTPKGRETKRMIKTACPAIAMIDPDRKLSFIIHAEAPLDRPFPADSNVAIYVGNDNFMVEMETMGPIAQLRPGDRLVHRQTWRLLDGVLEATGAAVRAAVS